WLLADPREDCAQLPQLIVHLVRRAYCLHDFAPDRFRKLPAQAMDLRLYVRERNSRSFRGLVVSHLRFFPREKRRERGKRVGFSLVDKLRSHSRQRAFEEHAGPPGIERIGRSEIARKTLMMQFLGCDVIDRNELRAGARLPGLQ